MFQIEKDKACCFFGHRKINETTELINNLNSIIEDLIVNKNVENFLFGSKSDFNGSCYDVVTTLKEKYPYIKRIYVRAEFPYINDDYRDFLLELYEETYFPEKMIDAGKAVYIERTAK